MYGFVYLTTNLVNGKRYVGICSFEKDARNGRYLGSGKLLKLAIKKYGRPNFKREVLEECADFAELSTAERRWIQHYDAVNSPDFYNLSRGGKGGNAQDLKEYWAQYSKEERAALRNWNTTPKASFKGKRHTEETKRLIGSKSVNRKWGRHTSVAGENNPMYGRSAIAEQRLRWFTNGTDNLYLPETTTVPQGFRRGRTMKRPRTKC